MQSGLSDPLHKTTRGAPKPIITRPRKNRRDATNINYTTGDNLDSPTWQTTSTLNFLPVPQLTLPLGSETARHDGSLA